MDLTLWLMGDYDVESVTGVSYNKLGKLPVGLQGNPWGNWDPQKFEVEDSAMAMIRMRSGATVMLEASWALKTTDVRPMMTTLCGTLGGAAQFPGPWAPMTYTYAINSVMGDTLVTERPDDFADYGAPNMRIDELMVEAPRKEIGQWLDAIREGREPVVRATEGLAICRILDAVYTSSRTKKPVYF